MHFSYLVSTEDSVYRIMFFYLTLDIIVLQSFFPNVSVVVCWTDWFLEVLKTQQTLENVI